MTFADRFAKAKESGKTRSVTPKWVAFDKPGDSLCGQLLGSSEVASGLGTGTYLQYLMRTDDGLVKFSLGAATDRELRAVLVEGGIYRVTYAGQTKIKGGRRVNRFEVEQMEAAGEEEEGPEEPPF